MPARPLARSMPTGKGRRIPDIRLPQLEIKNALVESVARLVRLSGGESIERILGLSTREVAGLITMRGAHRVAGKISQ